MKTRTLLMAMLWTGCNTDTDKALEADPSAPAAPASSDSQATPEWTPRPGTVLVPTPSDSTPTDDTDDTDDTAEPDTTPAGGSITLLSEAEMLAFCDETDSVLEDLTIECADCVDLTALSCLRHVGVSIYIINNPLLESLDGLGALEELANAGGELVLRNNPRLVDVSGLGAPAEVGALYTVEVSANPRLPTLSDWSVVFSSRYPPGIYQLDVTDNALLEDLEGVLFGADQVQVSYTHIIDNPSLQRVSDTGAFVPFEELEIRNNAELLRLDGLAPTFLWGRLSIVDNASLDNLDALDQLTGVEGEVYITGNPSLTSVAGLSALERVGSDWAGVAGRVNIRDNDSLQSITGFGALDELTPIVAHDGYRAFGALIVEDNAMLEHISGFDSLSSACNLSITDNPQLAELGGFSSLTQAASVDLSNNPSLPEADADAFAARVQSDF